MTFTSQNEALPKQYDANDDGVTDMADVQVLLDSVNGLPGMTEQKKSAFDLNGDGILDTADVQKLYEWILSGFTPLDVIEVPPMKHWLIRLPVFWANRQCRNLPAPEQLCSSKAPLLPYASVHRSDRKNPANTVAPGRSYRPHGERP